MHQCSAGAGGGVSATQPSLSLSVLVPRHARTPQAWGVSVLLGGYGQKERLDQPEGLDWGGSTQGETGWEKLVLLLPLLYPSCGEIPNVSATSWDKGWQLSASHLQVAQTQTDLGKG